MGYHHRRRMGGVMDGWLNRLSSFSRPHMIKSLPGMSSSVKDTIGVKGFH